MLNFVLHHGLVLRACGNGSMAGEEGEKVCESALCA